MPDARHHAYLTEFLFEDPAPGRWPLIAHEACPADGEPVTVRPDSDDPRGPLIVTCEACGATTDPAAPGGPLEPPTAEQQAELEALVARITAAARR